MVAASVPAGKAFDGRGNEAALGDVTTDVTVSTSVSGGLLLGDAFGIRIAWVNIARNIAIRVSFNALSLRAICEIGR
jgi:hypothetical protein